MPKVEIDYSTTFIYKITCCDQNIKDIYVGHTTNFVQRKHSHKTSCINNKSTNYKCKLYETIRCNGGWCNWKMEIINFFNCANHYEARIKEQEYFTLLNANLNSIQPLPKPKPNKPSLLDKKDKDFIYCQTCNVYLNNNKLLEIHNNTKKHIKLCDINNLIAKQKSYNFECKTCNYKCCKNSDYIKHLRTKKHIQREQIKTKNSLNNNYLCECGKKYEYHSGLWKHKKTCDWGENNTIDNVEKCVSTILLKNTIVEKYVCKQCNKKYNAINSLWYHNKKCKSIIEPTIQSLSEKTKPSDITVQLTP
uniref:GIY-YIG domain-containing protein n=1 Tax=viral metagenome TaxID=1070528 RepID=A0A6C0I778_9ZZZZ